MVDDDVDKTSPAYLSAFINGASKVQQRQHRLPEGFISHETIDHLQAALLKDNPPEEVERMLDRALGRTPVTPGTNTVTTAFRQPTPVPGPNGSRAAPSLTAEQLTAMIKGERLDTKGVVPPALLEEWYRTDRRDPVALTLATFRFLVRSSVDEPREAFPKGTRTELAAARPYHVPPRVFERLTNMHVVRAYEPFIHAAKEGQKGTRETADQVVAFCKQLQATLQFPALPFQTIYIGFGEGVTCDWVQADAWVRSRLPEEHFRGARLHGLIFTRNGYALSVLSVHASPTGGQSPAIDMATGGVRFLVDDFYEPRTGWADSAAPLGLITYSLLQLIERRASTPKRDPRRDKQVRKAAKRSGATPQPYYVVDIGDDDQDALDAVMPPVPRAPVEHATPHRHDVCEHDRFHFAHGPRPLDDRTLRKLERRGYQLVPSPLPEPYQRALRRQGIRIEPDEWLYAKVVRVPEHQRGEGEYVPGIRV